MSALKSENERLTGERKLIYRYVERHGPVSPSTIVDGIEVDADEFGHHLMALQREGLIAIDEQDAAVFVPVHPGEAESFVEDDVSYTIRPATQDDFTGVLGVVREVAEEEAYITAKTFAAKLEYEETLFRRTPSESRVLFVAEVGDDVVGWSHVEAPELKEIEGSVELTVGVVSQFRGHCIGKRLIDRGLEWADSRGCRKVYNSLPATNEDAIEFLKDYGCVVEAVRPAHYELEGELVDEVQVAMYMD